MKKQIISWTAALATLMAVGITTTTAQAASTNVNIAGVSVDRSFLSTDTYYRTTKPVTVHMSYYRLKKQTTQYTKTLTLPKGTNVAGWIIPKHHLANGQWANEMVIFPDRLNYSLANQKGKTGYRATSGVSYTLKSFKKVKAPTYMPTWSKGDLYLGGAKTAEANNAKQLVRITSNGYVELHHRENTVSADDAFTGKPVSSAKITQTTVKGATRYLYLNHKLTGIKTTRTGKRGAYRYRLTLKNLHQPLNRSAEDDDRGTIYLFDSLYQVGGKTYYTEIANGSYIND